METVALECLSLQHYLGRLVIDDTQTPNEEDPSMFLLFILFNVILYLALIPAFRIAKANYTLNAVDKVSPLAASIFWIVISMLQYGHQNLGFVFEVIVLILVFCAFDYLKLLFLNRQIKKPHLGSVLVLITQIFIIVIVRYCIPIFDYSGPK